MPNHVKQPVRGESAVYPVPAAVAIVIREGRVLLVRRAKPPHVGYWGFPGGKIETGETIAAAAIRELAEETSVRAQANQVLTAFDVLHHDKNGQLTHHFILIAVVCSWLDGEPTAADDALDAQWFRLDGLDEAAPDLIANVVRLAREASRIA